MSLTLLITAFLVLDLLVVLVVLSLARCSARADARAEREIEAWARETAGSRRRADGAPGPRVTPYPEVRERPDSSGARAAGARPRPQR